MKSTKKDFTKFTKRNTHKRRGKDAARRELMRAVAETEVAYSGIVLKDTLDAGRRGRSSDKRRRDETVARGIFSGSRSGFGFVTLESGYDKDIFIPEDKTHGALDGDFVEVIYHIYTSREGVEKTEGRVTKIIEYGREFIIGTLVIEHPRAYGKALKRGGVYAFLQPDDTKIALRPRITDTAGARDGDKIMVKIKRETVRNGYMKCELLDNFGPADTKDANYLAILTECGIPTEFTREETELAEYLAKETVSDTARHRVEGVVFTIDSETAKDLDDAISIERSKSGYTLGVHIADVSHYVREKTPLDRAVMSRGTSVYFTDKVIPMLPKCLSNGACSLNPGEDKYALSVFIELSKDGKITNAKIESTVIRSKVKGIYSEINEIFEGTASDEITAKYSECLESLGIMRELYLILAENARLRGSLDLESEEAYIVLDGDGMPTDIIKRQRKDAERLIEQFMLTANEAVATLLYENSIPCVYRVHAAPPEEKREDFAEYASNLGLSVKGITAEGATAGDYSALLDEAKERGVGFAVSYAMLRSMSKAEYSEVKKPHFGLGIDTYCHFTSPIRRLSDLATHRIIKSALLGDKLPERYRGYAKRAAAAASDTELRAEGAERRIENLYKVIYMKEHIGEVFSARISGVASHGAYALLDNTCEGLIPLAELGSGAIFEEKNLSVRAGERVYRIGDEISVRLTDADVSSGKLRFSLE